MLTKNHMKSFSPLSCFFCVRLRRKRHQTSLLGLSLFFISYFWLFCFQNCWETRSDMIWSDLLWLESVGPYLLVVVGYFWVLQVDGAIRGEELFLGVLPPGETTPAFAGQSPAGWGWWRNVPLYVGPFAEAPRVNLNFLICASCAERLFEVLPCHSQNTVQRIHFYKETYMLAKLQIAESVSIYCTEYWYVVWVVLPFMTPKWRHPISSWGEIRRWVWMLVIWGGGSFPSMDAYCQRHLQPLARLSDDDTDIESCQVLNGPRKQSDEVRR